MAQTEPARGAVKIDDPHWSPRLELNRSHALLYQWGRYEDCGTIDNFRIAAGIKIGPRRGFFYTDSDLHKWADAASRAIGSGPDEAIEARLAEYIDLMGRCQDGDGYLFTYNQIHFPGTRWKNLQIEHELYCHGHFIEAGVSHFEATGRRDLLGLAAKAADLIVAEFLEAGPGRTSGHEEIELALIRLWRITHTEAYLAAARALLERRGRMGRLGFGLSFLGQALSQAARSRAVRRQTGSKNGLGFEFGGNLTRREPPFLMPRALASFLGGSYQQQDRPMRGQAEPRGHSVRWAYLAAAAAMLFREGRDASILSWLEKAWEGLVGRKMYVTGGIGALPVIEGFGRPFELDNRYSYSETCAAIGCVLWNREMSLATGRARYADLLEWQLENAASVGISLSGDRYFYRNPLAADGELERRPWYATACCPSNISRLWAELPGLVCSRSEGRLRIDQYIGCSASLSSQAGLSACVVRISSGLPWEGRVGIEVECPSALTLELRVPGWASRAEAKVDGRAARSIERQPGASFDARRFDAAGYLELGLAPGRTGIELLFHLPVTALRADHRVRADRGRVVMTRGSLVYCAESVDNPGLDLEEAIVDPSSFGYAWDARLFGSGCGTLRGATADKRPVVLVPYYAWGNRGPASMRVWLASSP
jgi:DUF1680 family protein